MVDGHPTIFDFSQFLSTNYATLLQNIAGGNFEKPCTQFPRRVVPGHLRSFQVRGAFCPVSFVQSLCAVIMSKRELLLKIAFQFVALQVNQTTFCVVLKLPVFNDALSFPKSFRVGLHTFYLCSVSGILCRYDCNIGD